MLLGLAFERACRQGTNLAHPTAASPELSEVNLRFSLDTFSLDDSPVRRYSSRQKKRLFKFSIRRANPRQMSRIHPIAGYASPRHGHDLR